MTKAKIKIIENQQNFQIKNAEDLASKKQNLENWQGDNWLFVADWSDNYGLEDWYFEYNLTYLISDLEFRNLQIGNSNI